MYKKIFLFSFLFIVSTVLYAQSTRWEDYGLTAEDVKYLSEEKKQNILRSKTPSQTRQYIQQQIAEKGDTVQDTFPALVFFPVQKNIPEEQHPEKVSCFDYYTFGSVEADITINASSVISGTSMNFSGTLTNTNNYPIVEGTLYVKVFKNIGREKNPNGPDVVDQFIALDDITLPAKESVPVSFTWQVPTYATTGEYRLGTYFISDKKFNLLGLSFTDDIVGNSVPFYVTGEQSGTLKFDKSSLQINKEPYYFAAYPPRIAQDEDMALSFTLDNMTESDQDASIQWALYKWDAIDPANLVRTFETQVSVGAHVSQEVSIRVPENKEPVYLLVGTLVYQDTKSIINVRYIRENIDKVRLNFPALTSYPLKKNELTTLFSCLHNSGQSFSVENNKVVLELKDAEGDVVESYEYVGSITGDMMAVKKDFIPKKDMSTFSLYASLYTDGKLIDESSMQYDCQLIDPAQCLPEKKDIYRTDVIIQSIGMMLLILALIITVFFIFKRKNRILISLLFCVSLGCILSPPVAEAKSESWNTVEKKYFFYFYNQGINTKTSEGEYSSSVETGWANALRNPNITVTYNVQVKNLDSGATLSGGESLPVGTRIKLNFVKHVYTDISWFGTGYSGDSPYGEWREEGTSPPQTDTCKNKDFVTNYKISKNGVSWSWGVYIPLVVDSPNKTITGLTGLSNCTTDAETEIEGMSMKCTVSTPGTISPRFNFSETKGKFYYRYKDGSTCVGNNVPLKVADAADKYWYGFWTEEKNLETYSLVVPAQTITYNFTAYQPNQAPNPPTITGPKIGYVGTSYTFGFRSTDPDGDQIRYAVDWDKNGVADQYLPASGNVPSDTLLNATKIWSTLGAKTFQAATLDSNGVWSGWTTHTISIGELPPPTYGSAVCTDTTHANISWTNAAGFSNIYFRVVDRTAYPVDPPLPYPTAFTALWNENLSGTSTIVPVISGHLYSWWIHTRAPDGAWSTQTVSGNFLCQESVSSFACTSPISHITLPENKEVTYTATPISGATYTWYVKTDTGDIRVLNGVGNTYTATYDDIAANIVRKVTVTGNGISAQAECPPVILSCGMPRSETACDPVTHTKKVYSFDSQCGEREKEIACPIDDDTHILSIRILGAELGDVSITPPNRVCQEDCSQVYPAGTSVTLNAIAMDNALFAGWSGEADCLDGKVTLNTDTTCTATFYQKPNLTAGPILSPSEEIVPKQAYIFHVTISNANAPTPSSFYNFFQVATDRDDPLKIIDITPLSGDTMGPLATGASQQKTFSHTFTAAGRYFLRACADKSSRDSAGSIMESNEDDNCGEWTPVVVTDTTTISPGKCGPAHNISTSTPPSQNRLCVGGDATTVRTSSDGNSWIWDCMGINSPTDDHCSALKLVCQGTLPAHAILCNNDESELSSHTDISLVNACTSSKKCEYVCDTGYSLNGSICIPDTTPIAGRCGTADKAIYSSTEINYGADQQCAIGNPSSTAFPQPGTSHSWTCSGIQGGATSETCTASRAGIAYVCSGNIPTDTLYYQCPNISPYSPTQYTEVATCGDVSCTYSRCPVGQTFDSTTQSCETLFDGCFSDNTLAQKLENYASPLQDRLDNDERGYLLSDPLYTNKRQTFWTTLTGNINKYITSQYCSTPLQTTWDPTTDYGALKKSLFGVSCSSANNQGYYYYDNVPGNLLTVKSKASPATSINIAEPTVLYVTGADLQIDNNIMYSGSEASLVIVVRKKGNKGGNIYIHPTVTRIHATLIVEGAIMNGSYGAPLNWISHYSSLINPLTIYGKLYSYNTRGGSLEVDGNTLVTSSSGQCAVPGGNIDNCTLAMAAAQDLERFRLSTTSSGQCTLYVTGTSTVHQADILTHIEF